MIRPLKVLHSGWPIEHQASTLKRFDPSRINVSRLGSATGGAGNIAPGSVARNKAGKSSKTAAALPFACPPDSRALYSSLHAAFLISSAWSSERLGNGQSTKVIGRFASYF